jgi:hypothetical protein
MDVRLDFFSFLLRGRAFFLVGAWWRPGAPCLCLFLHCAAPCPGTDSPRHCPSWTRQNVMHAWRGRKEASKGGKPSWRAWMWGAVRTHPAPGRRGRSPQRRCPKQSRGQRAQPPSAATTRSPPPAPSPPAPPGQDPSLAAAQGPACVGGGVGGGRCRRASLLLFPLSRSLTLAENKKTHPSLLPRKTNSSTSGPAPSWRCVPAHHIVMLGG